MHVLLELWVYWVHITLHWKSGRLFGQGPTTVVQWNLSPLHWLSFRLNGRSWALKGHLTYMYSRLQKSCKQAEQGKPQLIYHIWLVIFSTSACPSSWFKHSKSIVVFHCSACSLQDCCKTFAICCKRILQPEPIIIGSIIKVDIKVVTWFMLATNFLEFLTLHLSVTNLSCLRKPVQAYLNIANNHYNRVYWYTLKNYTATIQLATFRPGLDLCQARLGQSVQHTDLFHDPTNHVGSQYTKI